MRRLSVRSVVVAACLLATVVAVPVPQASAAPLDQSAGIEALTKAGDLLRQTLGAAFANYWVDEATGQLVVGTTDPRQSGVIRLLGGVPQVVARNAAALDAVMARLDARAATVPASVAGWYIDVRANTVVVEVVGSDPAATAFAAAGGDGVRIDQVAELPQPYWSIIGGQAIVGSGGRCSAGFNVRTLAVRYVLTAGHCTKLVSGWSGTGGVIGTTAGTSYPGNDYGIIRVTASAAASSALVDRYSSGSDVSILGFLPSLIGTRVCRSGSTTGWRCGTVQALLQSVNYGGGNVVSGLTRTNACAEPGDSGGAFVSEPIGSITKVQAQGMTSGGSGNCTVGGTTFFQPVGEALLAYGVALYLG